MTTIESKQMSENFFDSYKWKQVLTYYKLQGYKIKNNFPVIETRTIITCERPKNYQIQEYKTYAISLDFKVIKPSKTKEYKTYYKGICLEHPDSDCPRFYIIGKVVKNRHKYIVFKRSKKE